MLILALLTTTLFAREVKLTKSNLVHIRGRIDFTSMQKAQQDLLKQHVKRGSKDYTIYLFIDSPGGSISAGNAFIAYAKTFRDVKTICMFCASMAHAISQALPGERLGTDGNIMMAHRAKGTVSGQFNDGEMERRLALWKRIVTRMEQTNANRIGITLKDYQKRVKDEYWTHGVDSVVQNVLDDIATVSCSDKLMTSSRTEKIRSIFGERIIVIPLCPLMI